MGYIYDGRLDDESANSGGHDDLVFCGQNVAGVGSIEMLFISTRLLVLIIRFNTLFFDNFYLFGK